MKRFFSAVVIIAVFVGTFWSCADDAPDDVPRLTREAFDAWVKKNAPNAVPYKDIYIEYKDGAPGGVRPSQEQSWITLDYTGRTLDGSVFVTRSETLSRQIGRFAYTTHYTPDFLYYSRTSTKLCPGLLTALQDMRVGDSARVYVPDSQGFGNYGMRVNDGYYGESNVTYNGFPMVFDLRLKASFLDPDGEEKQLIKKYVEQNWGADYYSDTLDMIFSRIIEPNPTGDTITKDSSVKVYYEVYFMDGFLAATNNDSVASAHNQYSEEDAEKDLYGPVRFNISTLDEKYVDHKVIYMVLPHMRRGEVAEAITVSHWAFGQDGKSTAKPEILPYQPLLYKIYALEETKDDDD